MRLVKSDDKIPLPKKPFLTLDLDTITVAKQKSLPKIMKSTSPRKTPTIRKLGKKKSSIGVSKTERSKVVTNDSRKTKTFKRHTRKTIKLYV